MIEDQWPATWDAGTRARADKLLGTMSALGAKDADLWVRSEISEDKPQLARYLILRKLWQYLGSVEDYVASLHRILGQAEAGRDSRDAPVGAAIRRLVDAGVDLHDVGRILRFHLIDAAFVFVNTIDEGYDPDAPEGMNVPGWALMETDTAGEPTGRHIGGLHESYLWVDPSGQEGRTE